MEKVWRPAVRLARNRPAQPERLYPQGLNMPAPDPRPGRMDWLFERRRRYIRRLLAEGPARRGAGPDGPRPRFTREGGASGL